ncbi:histidine kinase [Niveibacterium sp. 24ML]|uniref:sensor histidine kinase n=1 Tax=Niveibacterium sp. 24ML TaxID=2985512 RepID=UPI00226FA8AD|nr:histidine kinase [Niveibacterium sp. 24ML]MCX9155411.1 histidine kinase [Niveibacterium sp. 24ML]
MTQNSNTPASDTKARLTAWVIRTDWASLLLISFGVLVVHRVLGVMLGMPGWISGASALSVFISLVGWKLWEVGHDSLRAEFRVRWQHLSDWLAIVGWRRLAGVSFFALIAAGIGSDALSENGDVMALVVAAVCVMIAIKIARGATPRKAEAAASANVAIPATAPLASTDASLEGRSWLQRLTWPRLLLLGLLILLAAGLANHMIAPEAHPVVKIVKSERAAEAGRKPRTESPARPAAPAEPELPAGDAAPLEAPIPPEPGDAAADPSATPSKRQHQPEVIVEPRGIEVIERDKDGKVTQHVKIGLDGIRVSDGTDNTDLDIKLPEALKGLPGMSPEKAMEIEAQIREEIERETERAQEQQRNFNFAPLAFLVVVSLAIMKLLAGGKRRAELDAGSARVAADIARLEREAADAKLHAMQAQIEPHFLFNTLASVDQLIRTDPQRASQVQKTLIQYLRAAIPQMRDDAQRSTLGRQVKMSQAYLEIMQVRMEERLAFSFNTPEGLSCAEFPSMMLQTMIENCIKHGLEPKPEGGRIDVEADVARGKLRVKVSDTGVGFTADAKDGVGLANIRERLRLLYGTAASLTLSPKPGGGTIAMIELPYRDDEGQQNKAC